MHALNKMCILNLAVKIEVNSKQWKQSVFFLIGEKDISIVIFKRQGK